MYIDSHELKAVIDDVIGPPTGFEGGEYDYLCPFCVKSGQSRQSHLHVNYPKNVALCHLCGWGTRDLKFVVIGVLGRLPRSLTVLRSGQNLEESILNILFPEAPPGTDKSPREPISLPEGFVPLTRRPKDRLGRVVLDYLTGVGDGPLGRRRGLSWDQLVEAGVGYATEGIMSGYAIFPVRVGGQLITWTSRRIVGLSAKQRHAPGHAAASAALFNYDGLPDGITRLFITEGPFDAWHFTRRLHRLHGGVALLGTNLHEDQVCLISSIPTLREVIVCLDGDDAGRNRTNDCADRLSRAGIPIVSTMDLPDGKDPDELDDDDLRSWYLKRRVHDPFNSKIFELLG